MANIKETASTANAAGMRDVIATNIIHLSGDILARLEQQVRHKRRREDHGFLPNPQAQNFHIPAVYEDLILHDTGENDPTRILAIGSYDLLPVLNSHLYVLGHSM